MTWKLGGMALGGGPAPSCDAWGGKGLRFFGPFPRGAPRRTSSLVLCPINNFTDVCHMTYPTRHENRSPHRLVSRRTRDLGHVGAWPECPISTGAACTDYPDGGQRHTWAAHRARLGHLPAHDSALARAVSGAAAGGFEKGRPSARPSREYSGQESPRGGRGHAAHEAAGGNPLERAHHGEGAGHQSHGRAAYLDATQPQAPSR